MNIALWIIAICEIICTIQNERQLRDLRRDMNNLENTDCELSRTIAEAVEKLEANQ